MGKSFKRVGSLVLVLLFAAGCGGEAPEPAETPTPSADTSQSESPVPSPTPAATESPEPISPSAPGAQAAPWTAAPLSQAQVPAVLVSEWNKAENRSNCAAIAPDSLGTEGDGATARRANFSGGWAVAWDKPGLPGTDASGMPCATCGRGAFGVAGTGSTGDTPAEVKALTGNLPNIREWPDGSRAGFGPEGGQGPKQLAMLYIEGQGCLYNVWSSVSQGHLEFLLSHLRFVSGAGV